MPQTMREDILQNSMVSISGRGIIGGDIAYAHTGGCEGGDWYMPAPNILTINKPHDLDMDSLVEKMWARMFEKPAIISCRYCHTHNAYTNPNCVSCGSPMGDSA